MHPSPFSRIFVAGVALALLASCTDAVPVWKGQVSIENLYLKYNQPCEFEMDLGHLKDTLRSRMEIQLTYDPGINRDELPIYIVFEDDSHNLVEYPSTIFLKENNRWIGEPEPNEVDISLTQIAIPDLMVEPRKYHLKLYANDQDSAQIYGVVRVGLRLFEHEGDNTVQ